jgi:integrase
MNKSDFTISRFANRNGAISWRVAGQIHGERIRRNFKTREEAAAEKSALEIKALQAATGQRALLSSLADHQAREAEAVFLRLRDKPHSLSFYVDYALANYREPEHRKRIEDAVADYVAAKEHEFAQDHLSPPQMERIRGDLKRFSAHFDAVSLDEINAPRLIEFLELGQPGLKTWNNRRGILSTFFRFAMHRGWIADNPVAKIPQHRIRRRRGMAATLAAAQVRGLLEFLEDYQGGKFVPYYVLCLFAGIRPGVPHGEIKKLKPDAVNLDTGVIHISSEVSKTREPRRITIQPNLLVWLRAYPLEKYPIVVGNFQKKRAKFSKRFNLSHDVMRHTFISMFVAKFRSIGEAAIQAGNSESIIRRHYLDLKTTAEAEEFWSILPRHQASAVNSPGATPLPTEAPAPVMQQQTAA